MFDEMTLNARKPQETEAGNKMLERMNTRHNEMALWALAQLDLQSAQDILDIGCGGGMNIHNMLQLSSAQVTGIDYSPASVKKSQLTNAEAIKAGRACVLEGSAEALPFRPSSFDVITAFETIYYWPQIMDCFRGIKNLLKEQGSFMIFLEDYHPENNQELMQVLQATMYRPGEVVDLLAQAGFSHIQVHLHENKKWLCVTAE